MFFFSEKKWEKRCENATKSLKEKFSINDQSACYDIRWGDSSNNKVPFVLILYKYKNNDIIRREFYEFYNTEWEYVGYMDLKQCLDFYWEIKGKDVKKWYGDDPRGKRNDKDKDQVKRAVEMELDEYFKYYRKICKK